MEGGRERKEGGWKEVYRKEREKRGRLEGGRREREKRGRLEGGRREIGRKRESATPSHNLALP